MILYLRWPLHPNHICINYAVLRVNIRYSIGLRRLLRTKWLGARDPSSLLSVPVLSKRRKLCPVAQGYWNFLGVFILQTNHAWSRTSKLFLGLNKTTLGLVLASYSQPNRQAVTLKLTSFALWFPPPHPPRKAWQSGQTHSILLILMLLVLHLRHWLANQEQDHQCRNLLEY